MFIDSHCHLHDTEFYPENREEMYNAAIHADVATMIVVGTDVRSSREAVEYARTHDGVYAVVGLHPHDAKDGGVEHIRALVEQNKGEIVGIGEIGLDYYYDHSPRDVQQALLREQLQLAEHYDLPVSFHVREAFDDFWPIIDEFPHVRGVLHSFTDNEENAYRGLDRGFFIGINGIATFTKDEAQRDLYANLPLESIMLETDAPFLSPKPYRGKPNQPAYVREIAEFIAQTHDVDIDTVAAATTANVRTLFSLKK